MLKYENNELEEGFLPFKCQSSSRPKITPRLSLCLYVFVEVSLLYIYTRCLSYLLCLSSLLPPNALPYLHTYTLLFNAAPWVYAPLHALFPSICLENCRWTLEMSQEMKHDLGVSFWKRANLNRKDLLNVRKHIYNRMKIVFQLNDQFMLSTFFLSVTLAGCPA